MAYLGYPDWPFSMARTRRALAVVSHLARVLADHPEYIEKLPIDYALNRTWSLHCDGLVYRIINAARLVGPSSLSVVPWRLATGGVYAAVLMAGGVAVSEPSEDEWREWEQQIMVEYGDRETNRARYKDTLDAIDRQSRLGEWS